MIDTTTPDKHLYPECDDIVRSSMMRKIQMFFAELIKENLGVRNLIDAEFTLLNWRLAEH